MRVILGNNYVVYVDNLNWTLKKIVNVEEKEVKIDVNIIVEYGVRIPDVAFEIQNRVKKAVETMTGLSVSSVNIHIQGINIAEKRKDEKNEEIEETQEQ